MRIADVPSSRAGSFLPDSHTQNGLSRFAAEADLLKPASPAMTDEASPVRLDREETAREPQSLVLDLLNYIEQVEKLKYKPAFAVPTEFFVVYQHELKGLPELQFNLQRDSTDIWLRIPRLHEIDPPKPDEKLVACRSEFVSADAAKRV
jgi:hypothetical protein